VRAPCAVIPGSSPEDDGGEASATVDPSLI
jgi:hypothetical protein